MFTAYFAHLHGLKVAIFDALPEAGGQPAALYPSKIIQDIPVFKEIPAFDLIKRLTNNLTGDCTLFLNHKVESISEVNSDYIIDNLIQCHGIIIATGAGAFKPKAFPLAIPDTLENQLQYFIKDPANFAGKDVAVLGGGDSALDLALELSKCANVTLIHRRNEFRGLESNVEKVKASPNIKLLTPYLPHSVSDKNGKFELSLKKVGTELIDQAEFDNLLVAYGFRANNRFVKKWGIQTSEGLIEVDRKMQTSKERIFAVGDCVTYAGRVPVIGIGFGEAQLAISNIMQSLFPEKKMTIHSTSI